MVPQTKVEIASLINTNSRIFSFCELVLFKINACGIMSCVIISPSLLLLSHQVKYNDIV